jgi:hypothetical protein
MLGLGLLLATVLACNFSASTANISSLKVGKDENVSAETNSFAPGDTVYAAAVISNASENLKVKGRLIADSVDGLQSGPVPGAEKTLDLPGSGTVKFNFSAGESGWPKGKYKMEVLMMNEAGEQKDQKTVSFTVS